MLSISTLNVGYSECHFAEYRFLFIFMLRVFMLNVIVLSVVMLNVFILSVMTPKNKHSSLLVPFVINKENTVL